MKSSRALTLLDPIRRIAQLDVDESAIGSAGADFGRLRRGAPLGVVRPTNMRCLPEIVTLARAKGIKLTLRGKGLSQSGQAVANDSLLIDLSQCAAIDTPDLTKQTVVCETGATWRALVAKAAEFGLGPKVLPLNLDLTIGGTLSAGGFGSTSHRHGVAVSHVVDAEVAVGTGEVVHCGPSHERHVFDAVLGGLGRCGVMLQTELQLVPVHAKVRTFFLLYENLGHLLKDLERVSADGRATHLESFCSASVQGFRRGAGGRRQPLAHWLYGMHIGVGFDDDPPAAEEVLRDLSHSKLLHVEDDDYLDHAARYDSRFQMMRMTGAWEQAHPWFEAMLPADAAPRIIEHALLRLPMFFGDGHRILLIADTDRPASVAFPSTDRVIGFTVLPTGIASVFLEPALAALQELDDIVRQAGGRRYPSGWLFRTDPNGWKAHYGDSYSTLLTAKEMLDPDDVFQSSLHDLRAR